MKNKPPAKKSIKLSKSANKKKRGHIWKGTWVVLQVLIVLGLMITFFTGGVAAGFFASNVKDEPLRPYEEIYTKLHDYNKTGEAYFRNNEFIGYLRTTLVAQPVSVNEVSTHLTDAILATEDHLFYDHQGVNFRATTRAVLQELSTPGDGTGGSTITQQLVKNQILDDARKYSRKFKEMLLAMRVERMFKKHEILEAYMNILYLGYNANGQNIEGVRAAAEGIFDVDVQDLNIPQSAYLAGMIHSPGRYTPFTRGGNINEENLEHGLDRMKFVLSRMLETEQITQEEYDEALRFDIRASLAQKTPGMRETYPHLSAEIEERAVDILAKQKIKEEGIERESLTTEEYEKYIASASQELSRGGYKVHTTIDRELYEAFHKVVEEYDFGPDVIYEEVVGDTKVEFPLIEQTAVSLIDNDTGAILAMVEGRDFNKYEGNLTTRARQPGSSIKPLLVYGPALELGILQPASVIDDAPVFIPDSSTRTGYWVPTNYNTSRFKGLVSVRDALRNSDNLPAVKAFLDVQEKGGKEVPFDFLRKMGISTLANESEVTKGGVAVGGLIHGFTVEESTNAFATFANNGTHIPSYLIEKIETLDGEIVYQHESRPEYVFSEQTAFLMNDMLRGVVNSGTAATIRRGMGSGLDIAGKTGTTNDIYDYWFVGYTPQLSMGVWLGYEKNVTLSRNYIPRNQNLWVELMKTVADIRPEYVDTDQKFAMPDDIVRRQVCSKSGKLPSELCREAGYLVTDYFNKKYVPTTVDDTVMEGRVVIVDDEPYIAHEETPDDFVEEGLFIKREPLEIPPAYEHLKSRYTPIDWDENAPTEEDPRKDNGKDPAQPTEVKAGKSGSHISLSWKENPENDIAGYRLYRSSREGEFTHIDSIADHLDKTYTDESARQNQVYAYYITAVDVAGRESEPSDIVISSEMDPDAFFTPEASAPGGLTGNQSGSNIQLSWNANPKEEQIEQYKIYQSEQEEQGYKEIGQTSTTTYTHSSLPNENKSYWYYIVALNKAGESKESNKLRINFKQKQQDDQDDDSDNQDEPDNPDDDQNDDDETEENPAE